MASTDAPELCSACNQGPATHLSNDCKQHFCTSDFKIREQELLLKFENEIVSPHNHLLEQIRNMNKLNSLPPELFTPIDEWKTRIMEKVEKAAEDARNALITLICRQKEDLKRQVELLTRQIQSLQEDENPSITDIDRLKLEVNEVQNLVDNLLQNDKTKSIIVEDEQIDWSRIIYIRDKPESNQKFPLRSPFSLRISLNARWQQNGVTVAGGNGRGNGLHQLSNPLGLYVDDDQTVYVADHDNHRIMKWKANATTGEVVAGGNGQGSGTHQLSNPYDVIVDKSTDSLIICDRGNQRVVRWPRKNAATGETIISGIKCWSLTMDENGFLYIVDCVEDRVMRYGEKSEAKVVAGSGGRGRRLYQLDSPYYVFVDRDHSVYVSEWGNQRVLKWEVDAKYGTLVAGIQGQGNGLAQLSYPRGVVVDDSGTVYVADLGNNRIMRWCKEEIAGSVVVGGNGVGSQSNQLNGPEGLSFDGEGNLYVVDNGNHRVLRYDLIK